MLLLPKKLFLLPRENRLVERNVHSMQVFYQKIPFTFSANVYNSLQSHARVLFIYSFKGMNTALYQYKWGGEDWDLLDRILNAKLEVERVKHPGLYHHYQIKQKTWN